MVALQIHRSLTTPIRTHKPAALIYRAQRNYDDGDIKNNKIINELKERNEQRSDWGRGEKKKIRKRRNIRKSIYNLWREEYESGSTAAPSCAAFKGVWANEFSRQGAINGHFRIWIYSTKNCAIRILHATEKLMLLQLSSGNLAISSLGFALGTISFSFTNNPSTTGTTMRHS
jgi:hypothetical protein